MTSVLPLRVHGCAWQLLEEIKKSDDYDQVGPFGNAVARVLRTNDSFVSSVQNRSTCDMRDEKTSRSCRFGFSFSSYYHSDDVETNCNTYGGTEGDGTVIITRRLRNSDDGDTPCWSKLCAQIYHRNHLHWAAATLRSKSSTAFYHVNRATTTANIAEKHGFAFSQFYNSSQ